MKNESLFDFEAFSLRLDTEWLGRKFLYFEEIESTNTFLKESPQSESGTTVLAEFQTSGRGRQDRIWLSNKGENLLFSVLLKKDVIAPEHLNLLNMGSAVYIGEAIESLYLLKTDLKWPNDVLLNRKKVAGILTETSFSGNKFQHAILGAGINVNQNEFAGKHPVPPTSIKLEAKSPVEREKLFAHVLNSLEELIIEIDSNPQSILKKWKSGCSLIGERIVIKNGPNVYEGIFEDVDLSGALMLNEGGRVFKYNFGEVSIS
ncbi:MAG: biotin--[acetyl-CoA-carboxylase] ligase [Ignavibacteriales bacterium]|nr:Bifunctional ligase/repressor BirA [Ignavibacteriaceae bacterium]QOJ29143.1 MAG: biotin--[acetyl-CoA-carboxylase] ligase [Ignavibacteriales bacterium]